jgi:hypothetical protein
MADQIDAVPSALSATSRATPVSAHQEPNVARQPCGDPPPSVTRRQTTQHPWRATGPGSRSKNTC